jgi:hypothetical protein
MIWRSEVLVREHVVVGTCADSLDHNVLESVHDVSVISVETLHFLCVRAATDQVVASSAVAACPLSRMVLLLGDYIDRTLDPHALTHVAEVCGAVDSHFIGQSDEKAFFVVPVVRSSDDLITLSYVVSRGLNPHAVRFMISMPSMVMFSRIRGVPSSAGLAPQMKPA